MNERDLFYYNKIKWILMAMAQSSEEQLSLFPPDSLVGDELFSEYEAAVLVDLDPVIQYGFLSLQQTDALKELHAYIVSKCGVEFEHIWLDNEQLDGEEWQIIRKLCKKAIEIFGCVLEKPNPLSSIVIDVNE